MASKRRLRRVADRERRLLSERARPLLGRPVHVPEVAWIRCQSKHAYSTYHFAAQLARQRSWASHQPIAVYQCKICHQYHLTRKITGREVLTIFEP